MWKLSLETTEIHIFVTIIIFYLKNVQIYQELEHALTEPDCSCRSGILISVLNWEVYNVANKTKASQAGGVYWS